jgi:hypothetical protein
VLAVLTIYVCDSFAHSHGHLPEWFEYPQISLTGIHNPERTVYAIGFSISALILLFSGRIVSVALISAAERRVADEAQETTPVPEGDERSPRLLLKRLQQAGIAAVVAACGLALQGIIPLSSVACERGLWTTETVPLECSDTRELVASVLHAVVGANGFFLGTFVHGYLMTSALASPAAPPALRRSWSRLVKMAALGLSLFGGVAGILLPMRPGAAILAPPESHVSRAIEAELEAGGFGQRWAVGWLIVYWASFAQDAFLLGL